MKILRTIGILALVAGLVLGGAGSAFAQGPPNKSGFFGTVDSAVGYVVTLETKEGSTVEVTLPLAAKYMIPRETKGPPADRDAFELALDGNIDVDITAIEGRRVAVLATNVVEVTSGYFTADVVRLMLIPSPSLPPIHAHRVGIVDAFTAGTSITIIDKDGESHPFTLDGTTVYHPDDIVMGAIIGGCVTVVTTGDPKLGTAIAKAIVLHDPPLPDWALP